MTHSNFRRRLRLKLVASILIALVGWTAATAQSTTAQQRAEAVREARQAAAQEAAQKRATAAQNRAAAAQARAAAKTAPAANTAAATAANKAAAATGVNPAATPASASKTTGAGAVGSGTLAWQTRVYRSNGCVHNGNSAVCTFTFANQGNEATLIAGSEMAGIQFVDDAHVPHRATAAHFLDKYGTQQTRLLVQSGDSGTYVLTFPDVNSQVASGDFHLRQQLIGGVTFSSAASVTTGAPATASAAAKTTNQ